MNIVLIGSGGREHAFARQLAASSICSKLFIIPGNAGTSAHGTNVSIDPTDFALVGKFCTDNEVELLVVGPEDPLVKGMRDYFSADGRLRRIAFVGPDEKGARMEGSKDWSKAFMQRHNIPTAAYRTFHQDNLEEGLAYVKQHSLPVVLKADGLAAGKGVLICESNEEAAHELQLMIRDAKFGAASARVVVEEFLKGIELSVFVLCDGLNYVVLPEAKDYKRVGEGDTGLNTGGMGAISPVPFADATFMNKVEERVIRPTVNGLIADGTPYCGFIFIGLMNVNGEPNVIEYNCRMGDPETEVVLPRIRNDFGKLMLAAAKGDLAEVKLDIDPRPAATVMLVSGGYPEAFEKGKVITGTDAVEGSMLFHAGTKLDADKNLVTNGGRVMAITSYGASLKEAVETSLKNAASIQFEKKYYRKDIGFEFQ